MKRKRVPGGGSSYSKTTRAKACGRTCGTANKLQSDERSLRDRWSVLFQYIGKQWWAFYELAIGPIGRLAFLFPVKPQSPGKDKVRYDQSPHFNLHILSAAHLSPSPHWCNFSQPTSLFDSERLPALVVGSETFYGY